MSSPQVADLFASEAAWPFALREVELAACVDFLTAQGRSPRGLRIAGPSGSGKSFLVRELMARLDQGDKDSVGLYVDVPAGELEAADLLHKISGLLRTPRRATRDLPSFVGQRVAQAWNSATNGRASKRAAYTYVASRELTGQIPVAGPFVKALLPTTVPTRTSSEADIASLRFLLKRSRKHPVVLALDNVQFLPYGMQELLEYELADAGSRLRLVLIERVHDAPRTDWMPIDERSSMDIHLGAASKEEVAELIRLVMPDVGDVPYVAESILRRSAGNLKSIWFQLRLLAARHEHQRILASSYEDVILSLAPLDQAVLRFVVFTIGGLTIPSLVSLLHATDLGIQPEAVTSAIGDLAALGLLVVNGEQFDRVRVEHELISHVVNETTPEEEKLELRTQVVHALSKVLSDDVAPGEKAVLYDRFLGIVNGQELRQTPTHMAHVVDFVREQASSEQHRYLAGICRDSVCWDVLDLLPAATVRSLLDAIQKAALFSFGLVTATRLQQSPGIHAPLSALYEAKYLVQLFRYDEARQALARAPESEERRAVGFNIALNLAEDAQAAETALETFAKTSSRGGTEDDYVILRNAIHLFPPRDARDLVNASIEGFVMMGTRFGVATAINNRGIVALASGEIALARQDFDTAREMLEDLASSEIYQALVNISAVAALTGDVDTARERLLEAREAVPRSLLQDSAMLDLNELVLDIAIGRCSTSDARSRADKIGAAARKTRDLRFIDTVWCVVDLLSDPDSRSVVSESWQARRRMSELWSGDRVPLEGLVTVRFDGRGVELPYVLSPHWRH